MSDVALEGKKLDRQHLVVKCSIQDNDKRINSHALVDCGASGFAFIDEDITHQYHLSLYSLHVFRTFEVIDGRPITSGDITHLTRLTLSIGSHQESLPAFVTKLGHYPLHNFSIFCTAFQLPQIDCGIFTERKAETVSVTGHG